MNLKIVYPKEAHTAYKIAATTFRELSSKVFEIDAILESDDSFSDNKSDITVLIGNDAENDVTAGLYLSGKTDSFGIRYGTDDYCIRSVVDGETRYLLLAGGRARSTIYAVYRYFEHFCGCRWFWDGDRIASLKVMPFDGVNLTESPRFDYRGLRYFAHRSLHRFQAEHWNFEDWAGEIDWLLKKRLNLFMLRIGMDDLWQKAFPELVSYPEYDKPIPEAGPGYDDRSLFWPLEYRGELRKNILKYAFERDLWHPEDCGTMSHWYSRTPYEFLNKEKPELLPQATEFYSEETGRVFDVRKRKNFEYYMKLTDTHVKEYGKPEIFHTIGLGERLYSQDAEENKRMKLYVYRRICSEIKKRYPNAPLLIASWDLWMRFSPEEVKSLIAELDPSQSIILDYTSDSVRENNFTKWNVTNNFPWIFGIFSGFEPNSEIRGFYELTNERLKLAKSDSACRGLILWPELSHGDSFAIEYLAKNAWESETLPICEQTDRYCKDRYNSDISEAMMALWRNFMPIASTEAWSMDNAPVIEMFGDLFVDVMNKVEFSRDKAEHYKSKVEVIDKHKNSAVGILKTLAKLPCHDELTRRDFYDIARTVIGRFVNRSIYQTEWLYVSGASIKELETAAYNAVDLLELLVSLLGTHEDYSLLHTLTLMQKTAKVNPSFELTLKRNAENFYCRSYIYENAEYLYVAETKNLFGEVLRAKIEERKPNFEKIKKENEKAAELYYATPLKDMRRRTEPFEKTVIAAAEKISALL